MNIPQITSLVETPLVNKDGKIQTNWRQLLEQLTKTLQLHLDNDGHLMPTQTDVNMTKLNTNNNKSRLLYNLDKSALHVNNDGTYKEIQTLRDQLTTAERTAIPATARNGKWVEDTDDSKLYTGIGGDWKEVAYT
tara:strand:+ start:3001 stop:3405 length:405 start_codon:yes stop_codon:yes gene_type:complete